MHPRPGIPGRRAHLLVRTIMTRLVLLVALLALTAAGCGVAEPAEPPPPMETVTVVSTPVRESWRDCEQARQAWDRGRIREDSLVDGAVLIVDRQGNTQFCEVKRSTRGRFIHP